MSNSYHLTKLIHQLNVIHKTTPAHQPAQITKIRLSYIISCLRSYKIMLDENRKD